MQEPLFGSTHELENMQGLVQCAGMSHLQPAGVHGAPWPPTAMPLQPTSKGRHEVVRLPWHVVHLQGHSMWLSAV